MDATLENAPNVRVQPKFGFQLDLAALVAYLEPLIPGVFPTLTAKRIDGGQSNPSWILQGIKQSWVLRAKPAPVNELMPFAHAIEREFRILKNLRYSAVPVPQVRVLCLDESIIGVAFYVMDFVEGRIFRDSTLPEVPVNERKAYYEEANQVLVRLHQVDWRALDLNDFGRHDGYYTRLIKRWTAQYQMSRQTPVAAMEKLAAWLPAHIPDAANSAQATVITHGDFRLENLMFHPTRPEVVAVLDWELCTLGHALSDLSYSTMSWYLPSGILRGFSDKDWLAMGLPTEQSYIKKYAEAFQLDEAQLQRDWPFYLAFNFFRLSAILEGIGQRERSGIASSNSAKQIAAMAEPVAQCGWAIAQGRAPEWKV